MSLKPTRHQVAIYGRVSDGETGLVIDGAIVEMTAMPEKFENWLALRSLQYGSNWETMRERPDRKRTAVDGYFYFTDLPKGDYTLQASLPNAGTRYNVKEVSVTVSDGLGQKVSDIALPPTAIKGQITDTDGSVAMAKIQIEGSSESALSDGEGIYMLSNLEVPQGDPKDRTVSVSAQGYKSKSQSVELVCGEVQESINFQLEEENRIYKMIN
jgi:hypothetical protein